MDKNNLSKILTAVSAVIGAVGVFFLIRIVMIGDEAFTTDVDVQNSVLEPYISFSLYLLYVSIAVTLFFSVWNLVKHPDQLKKTLISLAVLGVVLVACYAGAPDNVVLDITGQPLLKDANDQVITGEEAASISKWVSTGINYSMVLGVVGLGFFVWDFIKGLLK